jgi:hypothetical protein
LQHPVPRGFPTPENLPHGSGYRPRERIRVRGKPFTAHQRLVSEGHLYRRWLIYPTGQCTCTNEIWVTTETWTTDGFGSIFIFPPTYVWYFWHYEIHCRPESACPSMDWVQHTDEKVPYGALSAVPRSERELLGTVADLAQIASLGTDLLSL